MSTDPDSEARASETAESANVNDETSTERSDYYTPPVSPQNTAQNTPMKENIADDKVSSEQERDGVFLCCF